jgi:hypothetical protein
VSTNFDLALYVDAQRVGELERVEECVRYHRGSVVGRLGLQESEKNSAHTIRIVISGDIDIHSAIQRTNEHSEITS